MDTVLELHHHPYLYDHSLGGRVSRRDENLYGLPVMPFNMGLELMAQAAASLCSGKVLVAIQQAKAHGWLLFQQASRPIRIIAQHLSTPGEVRVALSTPASLPGEKERLVYDAVMRFAGAYPPAPSLGSVPADTEVPGLLNRDAIYPEHLFHGPAFQSVAVLQRCGNEEAQALLENPSPIVLEEGMASPLVTAPQILDGAGQVVGLWAERQLAEHFVIFPDEVEEIALYAAPDRFTFSVLCRMRPELKGSAIIHSHGMLASSQSEVFAEITGLRHRRIVMPEIMHRFRQSREVLLSEPWGLPLVPYADLATNLACGRLHTDLMDLAGGDGEVLLSVIAHIILSRRERAFWYTMKAADKRRKEWLLGRLVAKETIRRLLWQWRKENVWSADIEILPDAKGKPVVHGPEVPANCAMCLSLSHTETAVVALAALLAPGSGVGIDVELQKNTFDQEFISLAFTREEQQHLVGDPDRILHCWCAKEAGAKLVGIGMPNSPKDLMVTGYDESSGLVLLRYAGGLAQAKKNACHEIPVHTQREGEIVVATTVRGNV
jgi:phosphopantetheinyl transferase (holo-ACP synthase)